MRISDWSSDVCSSDLAVYDNREALSLDTEEAALLEKTYRDMVHAGALLNDAEREQVKAINSELSVLTTESSQKVRAATVDGALIVDTADEVAGLTASQIEGAATLAAETGI